MTKPVPGGYLDRQLLSKAIRKNTAARSIIGRILEDPPGPERLALMLAQIAHLLGEQAEALREMESMRRSGMTQHQIQMARLLQEHERLQRQLEEMRQVVETLERWLTEESSQRQDLL